MTDVIGGGAPQFQPAPDLLRLAEAEASAMKRTGRVDDERLGLLLALAQDAIGQFQEAWVSPRIVETHQEQSSSALIAAARILYDLAAAPTPTLMPDERARLRVLAACAFAMQGNFPSAAAAVRDIGLEAAWTGSELAALALSNPSETSVLGDARLGLPARDLLVACRHYFTTGLRTDSTEAWRLLTAFVLSAQTAWEGVLHRCCRTILAQQTVLATAQLLHLPYGAPFNAYVRNLIAEGRYTLLPPQNDLIWRQGFLGSATNALVTLPTSTGKTLLAELAIARSLEDMDSVAIYVAPYIALGRQVYESLQRRAPEFMDVRGHFGDFNSTPAPVWPDRRTVLVVTPERLDGILRSDPTIFGRLRAVVFDEAHGIENGTRGVRLESLITRLKLQQSRCPKLRLILLSAVLTNGDDVRRWLGPHAVHYDQSWRPTARRIAFWFSGGNLTWLYGNDPLRPSGKTALDQVAQLNLPWPMPHAPTEHPAGVESQKAGAFQNVSTLAVHLYNRDPAPVLIACATKASTRGVATTIASRLADRAIMPATLVGLTATIEAAYPHLKLLAEMLKKGVAYHNASLPSDVKRQLEAAIKVRDLDFVSATTTLAEGVDMPFRSTIVFEWLVGFKDRQAPMSALVFRNIAGRCGRAGEFVEGDTIVYDNVLGSLAFTGDGVRRRAQAQLLGDPPPLGSAANDNGDDLAKAAVEAALSSQLMASIPENPEIDGLDQVLANATYAGSRGLAPTALLARVREDLLDTRYGEPFAKAASPMWLTPLGEAANRTGFSTRSVRSMLAFLAEVKTDEPHRLAALILNRFGAIPEQGNYLLRNIALEVRTQFYVKGEDMEYLATNWLGSRSYISIFTGLKRARQSKAQVTPAQWATGAPYERIAAQYDKFVDLLEYSYANYLLWLLRAFEALSPFVVRDDSMPDWKSLSDLFTTARQVDDDAKDPALEAGEAGED